MSYADSFRVQQTFLSVQLIQIVLAERFYTIFRQGFNGFFIVPYLKIMHALSFTPAVKA